MAIINTGSQLPTQGQNSELSVQQDGNAQFIFKTGTGATPTTALTLSDTQATFVGNITTAAGTTSAAPISFTTGTLKTSPAAGALEFVTGQFYSTPSNTTAIRGAMPTVYFYTGTNTINTLTTAASQSVFGQALTLSAGTYYYEATFYLTRVSSGVANLLFGIRGTSLVGGWIKYLQNSSTNFNAITSSTQYGSMYSASSAAGGAKCSTSASGTQYCLITVCGNFACTAGTVTPEFRSVTSTMTSVTVNAGSYFYCYPMPDNVGGWA